MASTARSTSPLAAMRQRLLGVIEWPKKGKGKLFSSTELATELSRRGHGEFDTQHLGMLLTAEGFFKRQRSVLRASIVAERAAGIDSDCDCPFQRINVWSVGFCPLPSGVAPTPPAQPAATPPAQADGSSESMGDW